ncbi:MAG: hypothetical protein HOI95_13340 [Chromatiales bacterium]|mgnify:CR=1 FL=1|jgi:hypothetical protein|nr:hypothetical protein [Chromatiales bacterium]
MQLDATSLYATVPWIDDVLVVERHAPPLGQSEIRDPPLVTELLSEPAVAGYTLLQQVRVGTSHAPHVRLFKLTRPID